MTSRAAVSFAFLLLPGFVPAEESANAATDAAAAARPVADAGAPFGPLPLVDEVECGSFRDRHPFRESGPEVSTQAAVLGRECRVMTPGTKPRWFAYRIGAGKGLVARGAYVLEVEIPDDRARTVIVVNRGCDISRGVATGGAFGDRFWGTFNSNAESLERLPRSRKYLRQKVLFFLHDRTADLVLDRANPRRPLRPADGFWVAILVPASADDPVSAGAAVARIRLFEVADPGLFVLEPNLPAGVPHRRVFAREGWAAPMAEAGEETEAAMDNMDTFIEFRARQARFLGMNAVAPDLLAWGLNQGWDASDDAWFAPPRDAMRWEKTLQMLDMHGLEAIPYFEYAGSLALNRAVRCRTLSRGEGKAYTPLAKCEPSHLDVTDPSSLEDARRLLDQSVLRYRDRFRIAAVWFRTRAGNWPISYSDAAIRRFAADANGNWPPPRADFAKDAALRGRYEGWWLDRRRDFLAGLRDHLRGGLPKAPVLFTPWNEDAGPPLSQKTRLVVTDVPADFRGNLAGPGGKWGEALALRRAVGEERHLKALQAFPSDSGGWEWRNATPPADPGKYWDQKGIFFTYPVGRAYATLSSTSFDAFRGPEGLAVVHASPANEYVDQGTLGGIVADIERPGPYSMMAEALAVANGDPFWLGYMSANAHTSGFPEAARRFHAAFLALPALRSNRQFDWSPDPEVVVRVIWAESKGTFISVVNTAFVPKKEAQVILPWDGGVKNAASGQILDSLKAKNKDGKTVLRLDLAPFELVALKM